MNREWLWFLVGCAGVEDLAPATIACEDVIDAVPAPPDGYTVALDAVALYDAEPVEAADSDLRDPAARLFAKTGLLVRTDTASVLEVPQRARDSVSIGWGSSGRTWELAVPACPGDADWLAVPGGYWVREPACVPLVVRVGADEVDLDVGVAASCAGRAG